jgi:LysM repeat protein
MDRICPYLALAADRRTAVEGYDPEHRCHARHPAEPVDHAWQSTFCLTPDYRRCDRFLAAEATWAAHEPRLPPAAPDAVIASTRLVVRPEPGWRTLRAATDARLAPARLVAAGAAAVGGAALVVGAAGVLLGVTDRPDLQARATTTPEAEVTPQATAPQLFLAPGATPAITPTATPQPTPSVGPTRRPGPERTPRPEVRTYTVVEGDTLTLIAERFGTTVDAIRQANGIGGDVINIGQVLVIP